jgi:hypothetical protein
MRWSPNCVAFFIARQEKPIRSFALGDYRQAGNSWIPRDFFWLPAVIAIAAGVFLVLSHQRIGAVFAWALFILAWFDLKA